ncbi:MAG: hypothetical protein M3Z24_14065, partial [Chloroflexota bacterium]|nr:hypothetical protein [Chloroflexota bacterium]
GRERTLYVNSDYRGEPTAMTNEAQHVVWKAAADAWGYVKTQDLQGQEATMNLRLPGQYLDAETGLHDNWHRSYDARPGSVTRGSYLSPDPIGYPDGDDPYAYVGGDPINRVDPTGLYDIDVHYYLNYFLAITAGLTPERALTISLAAQYIDENAKTEPLQRTLEQEMAILNGRVAVSFGSTKIELQREAETIRQQILKARFSYHFTFTDSDINSEAGRYGGDANRRFIDPENKQLSNLFSASQKAPTRCGEAQLYGEFLHAFADSYSHRRPDSSPISLTQDFRGHLKYGHDPDKTYDVQNSKASPFPNFLHNQAHTISMEETVFAKLQADFSKYGLYQGSNKEGYPVDPINFAEVRSILTAFNANTGDYEKPAQLKAKVDILNAFLISNKLDPIPIYNAGKAAGNRNAYLRDSARKPFDASQYPGVILP